MSDYMPPVVSWLMLAWKNLWRRPLRTAVSVIGVAITVATLFSLVAFQRGYTGGMRGELDRLGAHILVVPKGCPYDAASIALHGARWPCYLKQDYLEQVEAIHQVATAAPVFMNAFYGSAGSQVVYVGVQPNILALKKGWYFRGRFPDSPNALLVGSDVARLRKWELGQSVSLPEAPGQRGIVTAVLRPTGGADDGFIYLRLADAQAIFHHPQELTHILVKLRDPDELETAVAQLHNCGAGLEMNVVPLAHLFNTIRSLVSSTRVLLGAIALMAFLVAGAGVSNTILMAVAERTREIGIMRALGASPEQVFILFWIESIQVCAAGGIIGIAGAFFASRIVETWLRSRLPFAPTDPLIQWEWGVAAACFACAALMGSLAGLLPAWRASRLPPVEAIHS